MIERSLVPRDARLPAETPAAPPRRLTTLLDERTIVAANLPRVAAGRPHHHPCASSPGCSGLARCGSEGYAADALRRGHASSRLCSTDRDGPARYRACALPVVEFEPHGPVAVQDLPDVLEPDVINTGEVNLMVEPIEAPPINWNWVARTGSIAAHVLLIAFVLLQTELFPYRAPSQATDRYGPAAAQFHLYAAGCSRTCAYALRAAEPTNAHRSAHSAANGTAFGASAFTCAQGAHASCAIRLRRTAQTFRRRPSPSPRRLTIGRPIFFGGSQVAKARNRNSSTNLRPTVSILPQMSSPGRALEQSARPRGVAEALRRSNSADKFQALAGVVTGVAETAEYLGGAVQMLTPTEGIDFTNYFCACSRQR